MITVGFGVRLPALAQWRGASGCCSKQKFVIRGKIFAYDHGTYIHSRCLNNFGNESINFVIFRSGLSLNIIFRPHYARSQLVWGRQSCSSSCNEAPRLVHRNATNILFYARQFFFTTCNKLIDWEDIVR